MKYLIALFLLALASSEVQAYNRPRLAALALPGPPFTPERYEGKHPRIARGVAVTAAVMSVLPPPLGIIGSAVPRGIRLAHVLVNGSFTPGQPLRTLTWVVAPNFATRRRCR